MRYPYSLGCIGPCFCVAVPLVSATVHVVDVGVAQEQPEGGLFFVSSHHVKAAPINNGSGVLFPSVPFFS